MPIQRGGGAGDKNTWSRAAEGARRSSTRIERRQRQSAETAANRGDKWQRPAGKQGDAAWIGGRGRVEGGLTKRGSIRARLGKQGRAERQRVRKPDEEAKGDRRRQGNTIWAQQGVGKGRSRDAEKQHSCECRVAKRREDELVKKGTQVELKNGKVKGYEQNSNNVRAERSTQH